MEPHPPTLTTVLLVSVFAVLYLGELLRRTLSGALDLYDLLMLSLVAVAPAAFVFFPQLSQGIARIAGVAFPFVVLFGALFAIVFLLVHRLTVKVHKLEFANRKLVQELSLLVERLESERKRHDSR